MYSEIFELQANLLKAIAHPRRLEIIHLLRDQELPVGDIHTMLDLPQANISQHLMILRDENVVTCRRDGKQMFYKISNPDIIKASDLFRSVLIEQNKGSNIAGELTLKMQDLLPLAQDPVCHMRISPKTAGFQTQHSGQEYYFCASGCLKTFQKDPDAYSQK